MNKVLKRVVSAVTAAAIALTAAVVFDVPEKMVAAAAGNIQINATNFPDEVFRNYILTTEDGNGNKRIDKDGNGILDADEIASVTEIRITLSSVSDLKGIEFFTELTYLNCEACHLTELDVSQNTALTYLKCDDNEISELDVSKNTALTYLDCSFNALTKLDVSKNTELTYLGCGGSSNKFSELDVSKNIKLTYLSCGFTGLPELDVSKNTELTELACNSDSFTALDISNNTKLTNLLCANNNLTELDVSKNTELSSLHCYGNQLTKLDVSKNTKLTRLTCQNNQLASVDVSNNTLEFIIFNCNNNKHPVSTCILEPTAFPAGFDLSKASNWTNAEITSDNKIFYLGTGNVTYTYDCGNSKSATFTLEFPSRTLTKVEAKDATCTEDGNIEYYECSCGYKFKNENPTAADILSDEDIVTAVIGHTWGAWTIKTPATETSKGEETRECTACHTTESRDIPVLAHTHSLTKHNRVEATCTAAGNIEYWSCVGCGKSFLDENGTTEVTNTVIPANGHTEVTDAAVAATCTDTGLTEGKHCSICNAVITAQATIPANGHTWGAWTVKTPATETDKGEETRECSVCHTAESRDIPALSHKHTLVHIPEVPATETTEGVKEHWHCDGCGKDFFDEEGKQEADREELKIGKIEAEVQAPATVPKPEIATPKEELIEATLSADEKKMVDEGAFIKIILKVDDATNTVPVADKTAVTGKLGELTNYKLGQYLDVTMLKKVGEIEQAISNTNAPIRITFEIPSTLRGKSEYSVFRVHGGETTILRDLDSDPNTVTIETDKFSTYALTYKEKTSGGGSGGGGSSHHHKYIYDETIIKEATCTESGEKTLSCSCGQTTTETVPALGHDYTSKITKPATETENGIRTFTCTRCGDTYTEIIQKTGSESKPDDTSSGTSDNMSSGTSDDNSSGTSTSGNGTSSDSGDTSSDNSGSSSSDSGTSSNSSSSSGGTGEDNPITGVAAVVPLMAVIAAAALAVTKSRKK